MWWMDENEDRRDDMTPGDISDVIERRRERQREDIRSLTEWYSRVKGVSCSDFPNNSNARGQ